MNSKLFSGIGLLGLLGFNFRHPAAINLTEFNLNNSENFNSVTTRARRAELERKSIENEERIIEAARLKRERKEQRKLINKNN